MKLIKTVIALCLVITLAGCGKPSNVSEDVYNLGKKALEVTGQYLEADLTTDEANEKINEIVSRITPEDGYSGDLIVETCVTVIGYDLGKAQYSSTNDVTKQVKGDLENLKKALGK